MTIIQPLLPEDAPAVAAMRQAALPHKGERRGPKARPMFDAMFAATPAAADMRGGARDGRPVRIDVGEDEVLLDDSVRYAKRARAAGVDRPWQP